MDRRLLITAALIAASSLSAAPAAADHAVGAGVPDAKSSHYVGSPNPPDLVTCGMHRDGRRCDGFVDGGWGYGGDGSWAYANNRSWGPGSYNDWWNDRPDRAYPRWVQEQRARGTCDPDRMWWSGTGWHC